MEHFRPVHVIQRDTELATALRGGDPDALGLLYVDHGGAVYAVANTVARDEQQAADITIDVFVEAWHDAGEFEPGRDFAPWLLTILRRVVDGHVEHAGLGPDELVWAVRTAIDSLDDDGRAVVRLQHVGEFDHAQIAEHTGLEPDAVTAHVEHAERRIATRVASVDGRDDATVVAVLADEAIWCVPPADLPTRLAEAIVPDIAPEGPAAVASELAAGPADGATSRVVAGGRGRMWGAWWFRPALLGAAAAVLLLFGGIVVLSALSGTNERDSITVELTPTGAILDAEGDVVVTSLESGLGIVLDVPTLPPRVDGTFYQAWVANAAGDLVPVGTFRQGGRITMSAGVELDQVVEFLITLEAPAPADDIGQASSGDVVLRGWDNVLLRDPTG